MGDRGNVIFTDSRGSFGLYSHWTGSQLKNDVAEILNTESDVRSRLETGDTSYGFRGILHGLLLKIHPDGVEATGSGVFPGGYGEDGDIEVRIDAVSLPVKINGELIDTFIALNIKA